MSELVDSPKEILFYQPYKFSPEGSFGSSIEEIGILNEDSIQNLNSFIEDAVIASISRIVQENGRYKISVRYHHFELNYTTPFFYDGVKKVAERQPEDNITQLNVIRNILDPAINTYKSLATSETPYSIERGFDLLGKDTHRDFIDGILMNNRNINELDLRGIIMREILAQRINYAISLHQILPLVL